MTNRKPNILYILTDQQSSTMMSCAGNHDLNTPAMDAIAAVGCRFERAYCSNPVCMPSRTSLFSGQYPSYIGVTKNGGEAESFPEGYFAEALGNVLRRAGYRTLYGGKQHFTSHKAEDLGFNVYSYDERDELAECASLILRSYNDEQPFFMVVSLINPHDICYAAISDSPENNPNEKSILERGEIEMMTLKEALAGIDELPDDALPALPSNFEIQEDEPEAISILTNQRKFKQHARDAWSKRKWREHRYAYCRLTERVDKQIEKVLSSVPENTLIIFTSDHGDHDSAHRLEHKSTFYEEATRVPLIIAKPNAIHSDATTSKQLVSNAFDIYATICDYAGVTPPETVEKGYSLRNLIEYPNAPAKYRDKLKIECEFGVAVHNGDMLLARYFDGRNSRQLYDLNLDPGQMKNHIGNPARCDVIRDLERILPNNEESSVIAELD